MSFSSHHWHDEDGDTAQRCCMCGATGPADDSTQARTCFGAIGAGAWRPWHLSSWSASHLMPAPPSRAAA